jgi:hypothetical protein
MRGSRKRTTVLIGDERKSTTVIGDGRKRETAEKEGIIYFYNFILKSCVLNILTLD